MEKYRKFEDPTNGINPFIPDSEKKRDLGSKLLYGLQMSIGVCKLLCFFCLFIIFALLQNLRNLIIATKIRRNVEYILCKVFGRAFLLLLGVWTIKEKVVKINKTRIPNIFFSCQSSIIDWMVLMYRHAPKFLWIVKSSDSKNDVFIEMSYLDILLYGMGLKFLSTSKTTTTTPFNISEYIVQDNQTPLVIFPEATKTNRKAVIAIRSNLMDTVYDLINEHGNLLIRSEIVVKKFKYFNPSNTTDYTGIRTLLHTLSQVFNEVEVVSQDIPNGNFDKSKKAEQNVSSANSVEYFDTILQSHLMEPLVRNSVSLKSTDHISFLDYFHHTHKDASYIKKD